MPFIDIDINADLDVLDAIDEAAREAPRLMDIAYDRAVSRFIRKRLLDELQEDAPPVKYPIEWQSERQRRAFFVTDGFGGGIPSRRGQPLSRVSAGWRIVVEKDRETGRILRVTNVTKHTRYVTGDDQQRMHIRTGWQPYAPIIAKYREKATDVLIDTWAVVALPEAFAAR